MSASQRSVLLIAALSGALAVGLGAFGAHALDPLLDDYSKDIFSTASEYHFMHTLVLLATALFSPIRGQRLWRIAQRCFGVGVLLFSGSLYLLATRGPLGIEVWSKVLGPVTPLGGLSLLAGWMLLGLWAWRFAADRPT